MRVFVSIDLEGIAGVSDRRQVNRGTDDYEAARSLMAGEANAVVGAAFDAGAEEVVVNDAHGDMCNLRPEDVDDRALLQIGSGKAPHGMVFRIGTGFDAAIFVGYHARVGTGGGVLEHSYSGATVAAIRVNGDDWGETELNAAVAGHYAVPVALVTGDDVLCEQVPRLLPDTRTVPVKDALGFRAARSLSPAAAQAELAAATRGVLTAPLPAPFTPPAPFRLEVDFLTVPMAEYAALVPGAERSGPRSVAITAPNAIDLARYNSVFIALASNALSG
jgi:D-amino peptidase